MLLASIPQTARQQEGNEAPDVAYQGDPSFAPIETTKVERAVNTDKDVFKIGDLYYMCYQECGSPARRDRAVGGRELGPRADLPDSCSSPSHHVTYAT